MRRIKNVLMAGLVASSLIRGRVFAAPRRFRTTPPKLEEIARRNKNLSSITRKEFLSLFRNPVGKQDATTEDVVKKVFKVEIKPGVLLSVIVGIFKYEKLPDFMRGSYNKYHVFISVNPTKQPEKPLFFRMFNLNIFKFGKPGEFYKWPEDFAVQIVKKGGKYMIYVAPLINGSFPKGLFFVDVFRYTEKERKFEFAGSKVVY